jgi:MFS family permease
MGEAFRGVDRAALRVIFLSSLGGALEFYDFVVFGVFAAYVGRAFFPAGDPLVSQLQTLAAFAVGYLARPIGGLFFGRKGDTEGRRHSFLLSLLGMSACTIAMGAMPTYEQWGVTATIIFVALRFVQGLCLGGELPGALTYAVESVPRHRATLACGLVFGCVSSGVLLATGASTILHGVMTPDQMAAYGWRIAFILGGVLGLLSFLLRRSLAESPDFTRMQARLAQMRASGVRTRGPLAELFALHRGRILVGIGATGAVAAFNGLLFAHMGGYLVRSVGYAPPEVASAINIAVAVTSVTLILATWVGDLVPRRYVYRLGTVVLAVGAIPAYGAILGRDLPLPLLFGLIGLAACFTHGTFAAILADLFPTSVRFSGVAFSMNLGAVIFSALGPLLATWLIGLTGNLAAPAWFLMASAVLAFGCSFLLKGLEGQLAASGDPAQPTAAAAPAERPSPLLDTA